MMDFRQRLEQSRLTPVSSDIPAEPNEHSIGLYFATDRTNNNPTCLDLRLAGGVRKAVPYAFVTEMNFDIDAGIEILACRKKIKIIGRNLTKLFDHLINFRVRYVQGNIGSDPDEDGLFVKEILIEELD